MTTATTRDALHILLLGGTTEATALAERLARMKNVRAILSLAGRTANPAPSALPVRVGGFGGVDGLTAYLRQEKIALVIDATHPFAAQISANAVAACAITGVELLAIERPAWAPIAGDNWVEHDSIEAAVAALPDEPQDVFSGLGRQAIPTLCRAPRHRYLIRVVDPVDLPDALAHAETVVSRGPFRTGEDAKLFADYDIRYVLAKNAGGAAAYSKIEAARQLGITVHMVRRPDLPPRPIVASADEALAWMNERHHLRSDLGV
ncbi:MAG: cobalt-precorrin-6A reductase [Hyphomicrobium sp.]|uniref:cobalt-precorrin-6A reductase n=1 Tax=Hyphomicrobium sp. TaxID=82 RepID=UPI0039E46B9F